MQAIMFGHISDYAHAVVIRFSDYANAVVTRLSFPLPPRVPGDEAIHVHVYSISVFFIHYCL